MQVMYPPFSHNAPGLESSAITQICDVRFLTGEAEVMMRFAQDEWDVLSGGTLVNITFPEENLSVYQQMENPLLTPSNQIYFEQIAILLEKNKRKWSLLVDWVADAFNDMLDGVPNVSFYLSSYSIDSTKSLRQVLVSIEIRSSRGNLRC
jgi:hypothetical protein